MLQNEKLRESLRNYKNRCEFLVDNYKLNIDGYFTEIGDYELMTVVNAVISECERDKAIMLKWFDESTEPVIYSEEFSFTDVDEYGTAIDEVYTSTRDTLEREKQRYLQRFIVGLSKRWWNNDR